VNLVVAKKILRGVVRIGESSRNRYSLTLTKEKRKEEKNKKQACPTRENKLSGSSSIQRVRSRVNSFGGSIRRREKRPL